jgi:hypothetical protein
VNSACSESQESDTPRTLSSQMFLLVKQVSILLAILFIAQTGISETFRFFGIIRFYVTELLQLRYSTVVFSLI